MLETCGVPGGASVEFFANVSAIATHWDIVAIVVFTETAFFPSITVLFGEPPANKLE